MDNRKIRVILGWVLLVAAIIGWPLSAFTLAKTEPQFVLGLSWMAIILEAMNLINTSEIHKEQGEAKKND